MALNQVSLSNHRSSSTPGDRPRLALPVGDPAGIGPEVALKALADPIVIADCEITLVGARSLQTALGTLGDVTNRPLLEVPLEPELQQQIQLGQGSAASGEASFRFLQTAIAHTLAGAFDGIVTAPISKAGWAAAGHVYPGQTELLAEQSDSDRFGMMFVARSPHTGWMLRALLATTHIPLRQVPDALTPERMTRQLELLMLALQQDFGLQRPWVAIAGLNPHSGEQGQLGREELEWLTPWIKTMRHRYPEAELEGPVPPDTLWVSPGQAWFGASPQPRAPDAYLALYHDQGLIPVKLMAFDRAVNTTVGLPFVRTSPDHGTAFGIAQQGNADATSMKAAIQLAAALVRQRQALT